jgi:serine/threonine-protein kinase
VSQKVFTLGKYQLFATLGRGGMADVYLAIARGPAGFNKLVVVKTLRNVDVEQPAQALDMFFNEAQLSSRLNHPNVVHTYEVGEHQGTYFIVMEYLEGQSLDRVLKRAQRSGAAVPVAWAARVVADGLQGLHHAHEMRDYDGTPLGIVHRDVSPHNVFVTYEGQVKLLDFGIAKAAMASGLTATGVLKGKVAYMAPEQANGAPLDRRADLFSMGIVLWEALAGRRLMTGDTPAATLASVLRRNAPPVSSVRRDVPPELEAIVQRALSQAPDDRYPTAQAMGEDLEAYLHRVGGPARASEVGEFVTSLFAGVRAEVQQSIHAQMASAASATTTGRLSALSAGLAAQSEASSSDVLRPLSLPFSPADLPPLPHLRAYQPAPPGEAPAAGTGPWRAGAQASQGGTPYAGTTELGPGGGGRAPGSRLARRAALPAALLGAGAVAFFALRRPTAERPGASVGAPPSAVDVTSLPLAPPEASERASAAPAPPAPAEAPGPTGEPRAGQSTRAPAAAAHPARAPHPADVRRPKPTPAAPAPPADDAPPPPTPSAAAPNGFLTLDTYPWTRVTVDGRALGATPVVRAPLPPGTHSIVLENPEKGLRQVTSVTIKSGETTSRRLAFE